MRYARTKTAKELGIEFRPPRRGDAGYDLYCADDGHMVGVGEQVMIKTGIMLEIPVGLVGIVKDRSSMASKGLYTSAGVIDSSYRGEICVLVLNGSYTDKVITAGEKFAQIVIVPYRYPRPVEVESDELTQTERGAGGFGSTGD
jgi:dUTP pyrophosphatase